MASVQSAFLHVVADYAAGDLAFSEMISALAAQLPTQWRWHTTPVQSFDTLGTGFILAQLALQKAELRPQPLLIFANCAPRQQSEQACQDNTGEDLVYGRLENGVELVVVNSGFTLSFVKPQLRELRALDVPSGGSQFRSRDLFPAVVCQLAQGNRARLGQELDRAGIPDPPQMAVAYVDSFGNLKTTLRGELSLSQRVEITLNGTTRTARVTTGSFEVEPGQLALAPGSSGHDQPFWELFRRDGSAFQEFKCPAPGARFQLNSLETRER
jgi:hypothetical protein